MTLLYDPTTKNFVESLSQSAPKYGLLVPNRLFVGGLGTETTETELRGFFSSYGPVKHCKIMSDSNGISKGYGFVTFVSSEDVEKLLKREGEQIVFKNHKLNIGPAVRKQAAMHQVLGSAQPSAMGQCGIVYANGVPCLVQQQSPGASLLPHGGASAVLPVQGGMSYPQYPQLVGLPTAGGGVQMMMIQPQYLTQPTALMSPSQQGGLTCSRGQLQYAGGGLSVQVDPASGLQQVLAAQAGGGMTTAALLQSAAQQHQQQYLQQQQQQQILLSAAGSGGAVGLEQYLSQLPYMIPQHHQFHSELLAHPLSAFDIFQQQQQHKQLQQQQQQYAFAAATSEQSLSGQLQYFEIPQALASSMCHPPTTTIISSGTTFQQQQQPSASTSTSVASGHLLTVAGSPSKKSSLESLTAPGTQPKSIGVKRVLSLPHQPVCPTAYASVYGLPAVKILAGQGQQRIVTQVISDSNEIQSIAKSLN